MLYVLSGRGAMPPKEAATALDQLLEEATRRAVEAGDDEMSFWLAVDSDNIDTGHKVWEAVARWADANDVYVADTADPVDTLRSESDAALLALPADPDLSSEEDDTLLAVIERAGTAGIKVYCFNGQMYEIAVEIDGEDVDDKPGTDLSDLSMADLKTRARELGVTPTDWRSRGAIIEAIRSIGSDTHPHTPWDEVKAAKELEQGPKLEELELDGDAPEATEAPVPEAAPSQHEDNIEELVRQVVRSELTAVLTDLLSRLLLED